MHLAAEASACSSLTKHPALSGRVRRRPQRRGPSRSRAGGGERSPRPAVGALPARPAPSWSTAASVAVRARPCRRGSAHAPGGLCAAPSALQPRLASAGTRRPGDPARMRPQGSVAAGLATLCLRLGAEQPLPRPALLRIALQRDTGDPKGAVSSLAPRLPGGPAASHLGEIHI